MSGGLDSSSIAAVARKLQSADLYAHTIVYDRIMPDRERYFSGLIAKHLDLPIHYQVADEYELYEPWDHADFLKPQPIHSPLDAIERDFNARTASIARVAFRGD